jgi:D-beta-D-heptose 7-phosphate kinase / D-beta-D-heptose 1-phosphate adenosyltransferase
VSAPGLVVVGDALLDVDVDGEVRRTTPDAGVPVLDVAEEVARPGGAGLAAALLAGHRGARGGPVTPVTLVTALNADADGTRLRELLGSGLEVLAGPASGGTVVKCRWSAAGRPLLRTDRGLGRPAPGFGGPPFAEAMRAALAGAAAVLVSDYGNGVAADPTVRAALADVLAAGTPVVWDPHPRGPRPVPGVTVATPNLAEARGAAGLPDTGSAVDDAVDSAVDGTVDAVGRAVLRRWGSAAVAVTVGERGAVLVRPDHAPAIVPAPPAEGGDPCGAGDAFAGALARALGERVPLLEAVAAAAAAAAGFVERGGAGAVRRTGDRWHQPVAEPAR